MNQAQLDDVSNQPGSLASDQPRSAPEAKLPLGQCVAVIGGLSLALWWLMGLAARLLFG